MNKSLHCVLNMLASFLALYLCAGNDYIGIQLKRKYLHLYYYKSNKCHFGNFIMLMINL